MYNINTKVIIRSYIPGPSKVYMTKMSGNVQPLDLTDRSDDSKGISEEVSIFFLDLSEPHTCIWGSQSLWTIAVPPHTKRGSNGLQKTPINIFIGFDGLFAVDLKRPQKKNT
jgi:hypothetical protein